MNSTVSYFVTDFAAFGNQPIVMELLLKAGALVNAINRGQCSALHVA